MHFKGKDKSGARSSKLDFSVECTAALMYLLRKQRDAVGLSLVSDKMELHTSAKSSSVHHKMLYGYLDKQYKQSQDHLNVTTNTADLLHLLAEKIHKRSLVVIFSDMMDNEASPDSLFSALQHLKHNKHEVILFHVFEKEKELGFDYQSRPFRFIDMETGEALRLNPADLKQQYVQTMEDYFKRLRLKCMQYKIDFVPAEINEGYEKVLLNFLVKRAKLY